MIDRKGGRSAALAKLCQADLLSREEEDRLFGRLAAGPGAAEEMEIRNRIVESNLRLVVSLAKRFRTPQHSIEEMVSEALVPLIRCVESFDCRRGTRFSTYATRALTHFFVRLRRQDVRRRLRDRARESAHANAARQERSMVFERLARADDLRLLGDRLARLPARERTLVAERFGLTGDRRPRTFRELGVTHGLSKERVRVITCEAISRLRQSFDEALLPHPRPLSRGETGEGVQTRP